MSYLDGVPTQLWDSLVNAAETGGKFTREELGADFSLAFEYLRRSSKINQNQLNKAHA